MASKDEGLTPERVDKEIEAREAVAAQSAPGLLERIGNGLKARLYRAKQEKDEKPEDSLRS
ncbi:MAG: hypothetical protein AAB443_01700 [Patescibacteria group bacterium]